MRNWLLGIAVNLCGILALAGCGLVDRALKEVAQECVLDTPVDLGVSDPRVNPAVRRGPLQLTHLRFDKPFRTVELSGWDLDSTVLALFAISDPRGLTPFLGVYLRSPFEREAPVGFGIHYDQRVPFSGGEPTVQEEEALFITTDEPRADLKHWTAPRKSVAVRMRGRQLISLELTLPVNAQNVEDGRSGIEYTGENQTVCLKSATVP